MEQVEINAPTRNVTNETPGAGGSPNRELLQRASGMLEAGRTALNRSLSGNSTRFLNEARQRGGQ